MSFKIPILLITWRRPDTTKQVIDALRAVKPLEIYIASDGPSCDGDFERIKLTRAMIQDSIDWPCEVHTLYSETNYGCEKGVSRAIDWFFEHVEYGIILEDDCVPHSDFFGYCEELLKRYYDDKRVWCISGDNFQNSLVRGGASYYFSRYNHCWGWATWRHRWEFYSQHRLIWDEVSQSQAFQMSMFENPLERSYWMKIWEKLFSVSIPDTWDYRWTLVCMANSGLTVLPNTNLVMNIGFGEGSLHTAGQSTAIPVSPIGSLRHPKIVCRDAEADSYTFAHHFGGAKIKYQNNLIYRFRRKLGLIKNFLVRAIKHA